MKRTEEVSVREFAPRAYAAIVQLMGGPDRLLNPDIRWGNNFLANFAVGRDEPWVAPGPDSFSGANWHVDGNWFMHYLDGPEQGILGIVCWEKMVHQGGATFIAPDSIGPVARYLADRPEGVWPDEFPWDDLIRQCSDFREAVADAGDFILTHPLMLHRGSQNLKRVPRYMNNSVVSFKEPLCFNRPDGAYSAIEQCILRGLGVDSLDFEIKGERRHLTREDREARRAARL
ncbi:MAG: hypothetical protein EA425_01975 [Puniceicoccaceae bacterium]|nr:MAG: hypothetical protein EA425_01975 [Puniceicoccaceae bacterium]